jgi:hypothetical protein
LNQWIFERTKIFSHQLRLWFDALLLLLRSLIKKDGIAVSAILLGRIGTVLAQIILVRVSTELLTPSELGGVSQLGSLTFFFNILLIVPIGHYITRGFLEWLDSGILLRNLKVYFLYIVVVALIAAVLAGALQVKWDLVSGFNVVSVALLVGLFLLFSPVSALGITGLNLLNYRVKFALFANLPVWGGLAAAVFLFQQYNEVAFWCLGQFGALGIGCLTCGVLWRHLVSEEYSGTSSKETTVPFKLHSIFHFAWPVATTAVLWWGQSQSYKFVLDHIQDVAFVGFFTVGYSLASAPIAMYEGVFGQFYEPIFYNELKNQKEEGIASAWNNYARAYLPGLVVVGFYVGLGAPFLAQFLLGEAFRSVGIQVALGAAVIETIRAAGGLIYHLGVARLSTHITIYPVAVGAILAPVGVYFFGSIDPLYGTLGGLFLAGVAVMIVVLITSCRALPIIWPIRQILFAVLLSTPLALGLKMTYWMVPDPGVLFSFCVMGVGGVYVLLAIVWLYLHREQ